MNGVTQQEEISKFLEAYDNYVFSRKKNVDAVVPEWGSGLTFLQETLECWQKLHEQYETLSRQVSLEACRKNALIMDSVLNLGRELLRLNEKIKFSILLPKLETIQKGITKDLDDFLRHLVSLLEVSVPDKSPMVAPEIFFEKIIDSQLRSNDLRISAHRNKLRSLPKVTKSKKKSKRRWRPLGTLRSLLFTILFVLGLSLVAKWLPQNTVENIRVFLKVLICAIFLLWSPTLFVSSFKPLLRSPGWILYFLLLATILLFWVYGILKGGLIAVILLIPIGKLLQSDKEDIERQPQQTVGRSIYQWGWMSMVIVGVIITHENLWIIGAIIWWTFTVTARISFKHFRFTFDMISMLETNKDSGRLKRQMIYLSLVATIILLFSGALNELNQEFVVDIYRDVAGIAFGLIAILIGVQAIVPSITNWGIFARDKDRKSNEIREMKLYLQHNVGLTGFMQIFFAIFVLSLIGIGLTTVSSNLDPVVNFSLTYLTSVQRNIIDIANPWGNAQFSATDTRLFLQTGLFTVFVSVFLFSLVALYYLFITTNSLTLPIRDILLSTPVVIENTRIIGDIEQKVIDGLKNKFSKCGKLHGNVISELLLNNRDQDLTCDITLSEDIPNTTELIEKAYATLKTVFAQPEIQSARVFVIRASIGSQDQQKLFAVEVERQEFRFLERKIEGLDMEYKMLQLGASIQRYLLPESQIL